jgi:hypothetical protein
MSFISLRNLEPVTILCASRRTGLDSNQARRPRVRIFRAAKRAFHATENIMDDQ